MLKAKRRLMNFDFEENGANVSLVGPAIGSGANSRKVLAIKATNQGIQPTDAIKVSKALEQITVTLTMEEFLRKFFGMWYDDAETLTKLLGFQTEYEAAQEANTDEEWSHEKWMEEKLSKFTLMKSLHDNPNQTISDEDFIEITKMQHSIEPLLLQQKEETNMVNSTTIVIEKSRFSELETK